MELAVIASVIAIASCLQGAIGFGLGLLSAPVIALVDPSLLPGSIVLLAAGLTVLGVLRDRVAVDLSGAGWAILGGIPGTALGALLVVLLPVRGLSLAMAGAVLLGVLLSVCGWRPQPRPAVVALAGATSGVMGTATSIGGPPMALVWHESSKAQLRATMSAFFLVGAFLSLGALTAVGAIDQRTLRFAAVLAPAMILGFSLSGLVNKHLDRRRVRQVTLAASTVGAVLVFLQAA